MAKFIGNGTGKLQGMSTVLLTSNHYLLAFFRVRDLTENSIMLT